MSILNWFKREFTRPFPALKKEDTVPPPVPKFDPQHIRELDFNKYDHHRDYYKLSASDRNQVIMDKRLYECCFVGEQNGKTVRVNAIYVMGRTIGDKMIYTYES